MNYFNFILHSKTYGGKKAVFIFTYFAYNKNKFILEIKWDYNYIPNYLVAVKIRVNRIQSFTTASEMFQSF